MIEVKWFPTVYRFVPCVGQEFLDKQLMLRNYIPKHYHDRADSESVSYVEVDRNGAEFIGNKQTDEHTDT